MGCAADGIVCGLHFGSSCLIGGCCGLILWRAIGWIATANNRRQRLPLADRRLSCAPVTMVSQTRYKNCNDISVLRREEKFSICFQYLNYAPIF